MKKKLLLLEINEFDLKYFLKGAKKFNFFEIIDFFKNKKKLKTYTKDKQEGYNLDPWVQWVSVHTGKTSNQHKVYRGEKKIHLGPTEYKLLKHLMENPGRVYSREQLLDSVWGHGIYVESRTVDTHIRRLRKAINTSGKQNYIRTVRSAGYSIDSE